MPTLRLAYATQFLIAVIAVFTLWGQVGGQSHLDLIPWWIKLCLGAGASLAIVKATINAVSREPAWNAGTLKWFGITLALLLGCGLTSYYVHLYAESDEPDEEDTQTSSLSLLRSTSAGHGYVPVTGDPNGPNCSPLHMSSAEK